MRISSAPKSRWRTNACKINDLILSTYKDFGFEEIVVKLSTRPEKRVGSDAAWDRAEDIMNKVLVKIAEESGGKIKTAVNPGEGAFYGPKFEYVLRDAIGRDWQCGTTQVDFNLPERFGAFYIGADGEKKVPVMIHRAICGSMERFLGILIEHYAGHFPLWLAPTQVVVATITSEGDDYAVKVRDCCARPGFAPRPISATRRSTTRSANIRCAEGAGDPGGRQARDGRAGGEYAQAREPGAEVDEAGGCGGGTGGGSDGAGFAVGPTSVTSVILEL